MKLLLFRRIAFSVLLLTSASIVLGEAPATAPATQPAFTLPPGWVIEKVAAAPLVFHPTMACFDDRGRLFVADADGGNLKAPELLEKLPGVVRMLEDTDGDGVFDKSTVFADKLTLPQGVCWADGSLFVSAAPSLWKFTDTKGTGHADKREELVTKFGFTGNAADLHGPQLGPDGRLWFCDGRHGHEIKRPDGTVMQGKAARIFRCKTDGSELEVICGGGMDNPVKVAFSSEGEAFFSVNLLQSRPTRMDAICFAIEGGVYPWHDVLSEFKRSGELLPPVIDLGWVAVSGLHAARTDAWPDREIVLFATEFNRNRVVSYLLKRSGAGFAPVEGEALTASDPDFHPTDILQDGDESLLVVDTGGWFRIGCPHSQVAKPSITGAIYRIHKTGKPRWTLPDETVKACRSVEELLKLSHVENPLIRDAAQQQLSQQGDAAVAAISTAFGASRWTKARQVVAPELVWTLCKIGSPAAMQAVRERLHETRSLPVVRTAARVLGERRDVESADALQKLLGHDDLSVRREAASALGRIGMKGSVPALLAASQDCKGDRFLEHAVIYALIQINHPTGTAAGLSAKSPAQQRAALIALDQMDAGKLSPKDVLPLAESSDAALRQTAVGILASHADWSEQTASLLERWLSPTQYELRHNAILAVVPPLLKSEAIQKLLLERLDDSATPVKQRELILETLALGVGAAKPTWISPIGKALADADPKLVRQAVATAVALRDATLDDALLKAARSNDNPADARGAAYAAVGSRLKEPTNGDLAFLISRLRADLPPLERLTAARAIGNIRWSDAQLEALIPRVTQVGPVESPHLLAAFEKSTDESLGRRLVLTLMNAKAGSGISADVLKRTIAKYPSSVQRSAEPLLKKLAPDNAGQQARVDDLDRTLPAGDTTRGKALFFSAKAACATCHSAQGQGGQVGPDLSKIGGIRTRRDLIESIAFPSASFAREFETLQVSTTDGEVYAGTLARDAADAIYLRTPTEVRIPRANIKKTQISPVSVMPQGLDQALSTQELADVLAYLQGLK